MAFFWGDHAVLLIWLYIFNVHDNYVNHLCLSYLTNTTLFLKCLIQHTLHILLLTTLSDIWLTPKIIINMTYAVKDMKCWKLLHKNVLMKSIIYHIHDGVIKWKHFPRYWPFVRGIHRSPVHSPHKGQWRGALRFALICAWINDWVNNPEAGDLRRHQAHYDVTVMFFEMYTVKLSQPRVINTWRWPGSYYRQAISRR